jgi:K+-transporting ATPase c subunit
MAASLAHRCWRRALPATAIFILDHRQPATAMTPPAPAGPTWRNRIRSWSTRIQGDIDKLVAQNPGKPVPIDLVTTSGSGLDPDITPDAAYYQVHRVALARHLSDDRNKLIAAHVTPRTLGMIGEPRVNVLELNLDLDALTK